jgi:hypothetical protein
MSNHPHRRKPPSRPLEGPGLARLLTRAEGMTHEIAAKMLSERERMTLATRPDLVGSNDARWRLTAAGKEFSRQCDTRADALPVNANRIWWLVRKLLAVDDEEAEIAAIEAGLEVTRSRIKGWRMHPYDRKHAAMTLEELEAVLVGLLAFDDGDQGYSAGEDET